MLSVEELKDNDDIFESIALLQRCFEEMKYEKVGYSFDIRSVFNSLVSCMENGVVLIAKEHDRVTGISCVFIFPCLMDNNNMQAIEAVWHADPYLDRIKRARIMILLLKEMESKIKEKGFKGIHLNTSIDYPMVAEYLKKKGYKLREQHYYKEI